jgi:hypothetical protein
MNSYTREYLVQLLSAGDIYFNGFRMTEVQQVIGRKTVSMTEKCNILIVRILHFRFYQLVYIQKPLFLDNHIACQSLEILNGTDPGARPFAA